jgi:hypothetical protein
VHPECLSCDIYRVITACSSIRSTENINLMHSLTTSLTTARAAIKD